MARQSLALRVSMDLKKFGAGLVKMEGGLKGAAKNIAGLGAAIGPALAASAAVGAGAAVKMATEFNRSMSQVATLLGGNTERVKELKENVESLALQTGKSTLDISKGLYDTVSAFGDSADSAEILETAVLAAGAAGDTTESAVALLSATMKSYGTVNADTAKKVADLAFGTIRLGQTTLPELSAGLQGTAGMAASTGVRMEEMYAVLATGTGVLGDASQTMTTMSALMKALQGPGKEMAAVMEEAGYATGKAWVEGEGLAGVMNQIKAHSDKTGTALQKYTGRMEGAKLIQQLAGASAGTYADKLAELESSTGELNTAVDAQRGGVGKLAFAFDQLKAAGQVVMQVLGDGVGYMLQSFLVPVAKKLAEFVGTLRDRFAGLGEQSRDSSTVLGRLGETFGSLRGYVEALWVVWGPVFAEIAKSVKTAASLVWDSFKQIIDAIGIVLDVVAGAGTALYQLFTGDWRGALETLSTMWNKVWTKLQAMALRAVDMLLKTFERFLGKVPGVGKKITEWRAGLAAQMEQIGKDQQAAELATVEAGGAAQAAAYESAGAAQVAAVKAVGAQMVAATAATGEAMAAAVEKSWGVQVEAVETAGARLVGAQSGLIAVQEPAWMQHWQNQEGGTRDGLKRILGLVDAGYDGMKQSTGQNLASILAGTNSFMEKMGGLMGGGLSNLLSAGGPWGQALAQGIQLFKKFGIDIDKLWNKAMEGIKKGLSRQWEGFKSLFAEIKKYDINNYKNPNTYAGAGGPGATEVPEMPVGTPTEDDYRDMYGGYSGGSHAGGSFKQEINIEIDGDKVAGAVLRGIPRQAKIQGVYS